MTDKSLADKAVSLLAQIDELERLLAQVNDYGDAPGFCKEYDNLRDDASSSFSQLLRRALTLKRRFELNQPSAES